MFTGTTLREHFVSDEFFAYSGTLNIIDNYNIFGIKSDAINFYVDNFNEVGCHTILIYFQVDFDSDKDYVDCIYDLADRCGWSNYDTFHTLYSLLQTGFKFNVDRNYNPNNEKDKKKLWESFLISLKHKKYKVDGAISFIKKMRQIGIQVYLIPFSDTGIKPPFHGRYWLAKSNDNFGKGYIVDASLNTYGKGRIFAQLMDRENFSLVSDFFDNLIVKNILKDVDKDVCINLEILSRFKSDLDHFFRQNPIFTKTYAK